MPRERKAADPPPVAERVLLTVADAAKSLAVTPARVLALLKRGELAGCGSGRDRRVFADSVEGYVPRPRPPRRPERYDFVYLGPLPEPELPPMTDAEWDCLFTVVQGLLDDGTLPELDETDERFPIE